MAEEEEDKDSIEWTARSIYRKMRPKPQRKHQVPGTPGEPGPRPPGRMKLVEEPKPKPRPKKPAPKPPPEEDRLGESPLGPEDKPVDRLGQSLPEPPAWSERPISDRIEEISVSALERLHAADPIRLPINKVRGELIASSRRRLDEREQQDRARYDFSRRDAISELANREYRLHEASKEMDRLWRDISGLNYSIDDVAQGKIGYFDSENINRADRHAGFGDSFRRSMVYFPKEEATQRIDAIIAQIERRLEGVESAMLDYIQAGFLDQGLSEEEAARRAEEMLNGDELLNRLRMKFDVLKDKRAKMAGSEPQQ